MDCRWNWQRTARAARRGSSRAPQAFGHGLARVPRATVIATAAAFGHLACENAPMETVPATLAARSRQVLVKPCALGQVSVVGEAVRVALSPLAPNAQCAPNW